MEYLIRCERCGHGISAHEPAGCSAAGCECRASLHDIVEFELTFTRREIRRQWHRHGEPPPAR